MKPLVPILVLPALLHAADSGPGWQWDFDPADQPYPSYLADPDRPRTGVTFSYADSDIEGATGRRIDLAAGIRYTLFKVTPANRFSTFSIDLEGALFNQFDNGNGHDCIAWEGRMGVWLVQEWNDQLAYRIGWRHRSSHLGDEYLDAVARDRIDYIRDSAALGLAWTIDERWTVYSEVDYALGDGRNSLQEPWLFMVGGQWQGDFRYLDGIGAPYAAAHWSSYEENDYDLNTSLQVGMLFNRGPNRAEFRVAAEFYDGRAKQGEFVFDQEETYLGLTVALDFY